MNIPKNQIIYVTLRASDGSDIVTDQPVRFNSDLFSIAVTTDHE